MNLTDVVTEHLMLLDRGPEMKGPVFFSQLWKSRERLREALQQAEAISDLVREVAARIVESQDGWEWEWHEDPDRPSQIVGPVNQEATLRNIAAAILGRKK